MPRSVKEIITEIKSLDGIDRIVEYSDQDEKLIGAIDYIRGYIDALTWCISTTNEEGEA